MPGGNKEREGSHASVLLTFHLPSGRPSTAKQMEQITQEGSAQTIRRSCRPMEPTTT